MKERDYEEIRDRMRPGDIVAFGGKGIISNGIKIVTGCNVSHVAMVLSSSQLAEMPMVLLAESTSLGDGFAGVQFNRLSDRLRGYEGEVWWLPLNKVVRGCLDIPKLAAFLVSQKGKKYDALQALGSGVDIEVFGHEILENNEDLSKLFCSEYNTAAFEDNFGMRQFMLDAGRSAWTFFDINASEQTPFDVVKFPIYQDPVQICGEAALELY